MAGFLAPTLTDRYAAYHADCLPVLAALPDASIHLSVYSPPFAGERGGLYQYSSSERDLSNCASYEEFFAQYELIVRELARVTMPGRISAVHCIDVPFSNSGKGDNLRDFPGDIIRLHQRLGWGYYGRYHVWKEPLAVRMRTMTKGLAHRTVVEDSSRCSVASADYLLILRRDGANPVPIAHPTGLTSYAGERQPPADVLRYRGWRGEQTENRYSHWVWRQYADAFWDDVRIDRVLPFQAAREEEDERHVHPLQLDVIERAIVLWSNPGERVLTPFMGVGSELWGAVRLGRFGIGAELKEAYYRQAVANLKSAAEEAEPLALFDLDALAPRADAPTADLAAVGED